MTPISLYLVWAGVIEGLRNSLFVLWWFHCVSLTPFFSFLCCKSFRTHFLYNCYFQLCLHHLRTSDDIWSGLKENIREMFFLQRGQSQNTFTALQDWWNLFDQCFHLSCLKRCLTPILAQRHWNVMGSSWGLAQEHRLHWRDGQSCPSLRCLCWVKAVEGVWDRISLMRWAAHTVEGLSLPRATTHLQILHLR